MTKRILTLALALLALLCCACAEEEQYSPIPPTEEESRAVATVGKYSVLYDELRFVALNSREGISNMHGVDWSDPSQAAEYAGELDESVWSSLVRNYAVFTLFEEAYEDSSLFEEQITEQVVAFVESCGGMKGYRDYLAENRLTDRLVRLNLTVSLMEYELLSYYTDLLGIIDGSEAALADFFFGDDTAHVMHICLDGTDESTVALAAELCERIESGEDVFELAAEYSRDFDAVGEGGEYILHGDYVEEYEDVAFSLYVGEADYVTAYGSTYVICAIEKDMDYFVSNYDSFRYRYMYAELDKIIEGQCDVMSIEKTELGASLDLVGIR